MPWRQYSPVDGKDSRIVCTIAGGQYAEVADGITLAPARAQRGTTACCSPMGCERHALLPCLASCLRQAPIHLDTLRVYTHMWVRVPAGVYTRACAYAQQAQARARGERTRV